MSDKRHHLSEIIRSEALRQGFSACGIAPAGVLEEDSQRLQAWLSRGHHAGMDYMQKHAGLRADPATLVENARSVVVLLTNYYPAAFMDPESDYRVSAYAYGEDYHEVIRAWLNRLADRLREESPGIAVRGFVDSAPVLERAWAVRAGLGWIGKNSMMITKRDGSFFFISELITDAELEYDKPMGGSYCGDCSRCVDACPTGAITGLRTVDSGKCISYLTIENKGEMPENLRGTYRKWIFGCDICQQVCPWNQRSEPHAEPAFEPLPGLLQLRKSEWEQMTEEEFRARFRKSAVKRTKFAGLKRNIRFLNE
jgi:epoxyqueuosine reductase